MMKRCGSVLTWMILVAAMVAGGCKGPEPVQPQYSRQLPPGAFGLRLITDPARMPDLAPVADQLADGRFREALQGSLGWYAAPSSQQYFPIGPISHAHATASAYALKVLGETEPASALAQLRAEFDVWESVGWDGSGAVLFTGYYTPIFRASRTRGGAYQYPLYARPTDLVTDPTTGEIRGRQTQAGVVAYPTRAEIEQQGLLAGQEIAWLASRLDAYLIHVNGSARLDLDAGGSMYVGYAGTNGRQYTSIGKLLVRDGKVDPNRMSVSAIRDYFGRNPGELEHYLSQNERFVFFTEADGSSWPAGSLGVKVTPMRSLATDKSVFPRACVVLVDTTIPGSTGQPRPLRQLMVDQDTGGAIRAAGRADIYVGIGEHAGAIAGRQAAEGKMYYLLLKPERVQAWYERMAAGE